MVAITEDSIRELAAYRPAAAPVTTCYLNVDGPHMARTSDIEAELERVVRGARGRANGDGSVAGDLDRVKAYIRDGFDRSHTRGLAFFSCSAEGFWEVVNLPVPVRSRVVFATSPAVSQLELLVSSYRRFGVLLADKQRARVFVFHLGELTDRSELFDELPRDYDTKGEKDQGDHQAHVDALASQHLRRAAAAAFALHQEHGFEHFTFGCPDAIAGELESYLHTYLKERLAPRIAVQVGDSLDAIRQAAMAVEDEVDRGEEAAEVERLRASVATANKGVGGLGETLAALNEHRVDALFVSDGFSEPGWRCPSCDALTLVGRSCPSCNADLDHVEDVVEEAIDVALGQRCRVRVCVGNADLDVLGRVGALLRY